MNKIKRRNLDKELLGLVSNATQAGNIKLQDFSPELQDTINKALNAGLSGGAYNDTVLVNAINNLKTTKADKSALTNYFNKTTEKITSAMLDADLVDVISKNAGEKINLDGYRKKEVPIDIADLSLPVTYRFEAIEKNIDNIKTETSVLRTDVNSINQQLTSITGISEKVADINTLRTDLDGLKTNVDTLSSAVGNANTNIATIETSITDINAELKFIPSASNPITSELLDNALNQRLDKIATIEETVNVLKTTSKIEAGTPGQLAVFAGETGIANCDLLYFGTITRSAEETAAAIAKAESHICDISNNIIYISDLILEEIDKNIKELIVADTMNPGYHYLQNFTDLYMFDGKLIFDENTGEMIYLGDPITVIKKADANKTITIASNDLYFYNLANPYSKSLKVLVLDKDTSSRTYNKYINSEAVATVAYDDTGITIYNDSDSALQFKICC